MTHSFWTVDVGPMVNPVDVDDALVLVDPIDDAVRPDACAVPAFELPPEGMPDWVGAGDQAAEAEPDDCSYYSW